MTTDSFSAERQPNGDVYIMYKTWSETLGILVRKEHCDELAMFLLRPNTLTAHWLGTVPSTDYTRGSDDPE